MFQLMNAFYFSVFLAITSAQMTIYAPEDLGTKFQNSTIHYSLGNIGFIPYGQRLMTKLNLPMVDKDTYDPTQTGCQTLTQNDEQLSNWGIIVNRGGCSFVTKGYYAELAGANIVVIIDNVDNEDVDGVMMMDDHTGHRVNIPVVLISKADGDIIMEYWKSKPNMNVLAYLDFVRPNTSTLVNYEYWMSSMDYDSYDFIIKFIDVHTNFKNLVNFTPHYALWYCVHCQSNNYTINEDTQLCLSGGRYCAPDPDGNGPLEGYIVVEEDLRQLCIFKKNPKAWWEYTYRFRDQCLISINSPDRLSAAVEFNECTKGLIADVGLNFNDIQSCIDDSYQGKKNKKLDDNSILMVERKQFEDQRVQIWPYLIVNGFGFRGDLNATDPAWEFVCEGFSELPSPMCDKWNSDIIRDNSSVIGGNEGHTGTYVLVILLVVVFIFVVMFIYRRMIKKQMLEEVNFKVRESVSQYYAMNDNQKSFRAIRDQKIGVESL